MWAWWKRNQRQRERLEEIRQERGKLAVAVKQLDRKRIDVEQLMRDMLEERRITGEQDSA